jgi:rhodanese-related sulfurtransferase
MAFRQQNRYTLRLFQAAQGFTMQNFLVFVVHHWFLVAIFIILLVALIWLETQGKVSGMARVSPQQAVNMVNRQDAVVFDIREKGLFNKGHIAGAQHLSTEQLETKNLSKYVEKPAIFVCGNGASAPKIGNQLKKLGLTKVFFLQGGITAWQAANLPLVKK